MLRANQLCHGREAGSGSSRRLACPRRCGSRLFCLAPCCSAHPARLLSTPVQTHCALSGEPFEQFWDEAHQEWRYRGAKALGAEEAARWVVLWVGREGVAASRGWRLGSGSLCIRHA